MRALKIPLLIAVFGGAAAAAPAEPPRMDVDVYRAGQDGYHTYRVPAIEIAPDGSLLVIAEGRKYTDQDPGYKGQEVDLVCKRSTDGGATWSPMTVIEHAGHLWGSANPATVVDRSNGRVWVFYVRVRPERNSYAAEAGTDDIKDLARWSVDNGKSWSEPVYLTRVARDVNDFRWRASIPGPGGAIQTRTSRIIVPMWKMPFADFAIYTDDHGQSWYRSQIVPGIQGGDECKVVELNDGRILFDMRQEAGSGRWLAESADGGETWTHLRRGPKFTAVACGFKRLADSTANSGRGWLIWTGPEGERKRLVIRTSPDEGKTFPYQRQISEEFAAYSDLVLLPRGSIGVIWEGGQRDYRTITFTRLSQDWLAPVFPHR